MVARMLRRLIVGALLIAAVWFGAFSTMEYPRVAIGGVLLLLFGHAAILGGEFMLMAWSNRNDAAPPAGLGQVLGAWIAESMLAPRVFCWQQPFRSRLVPDEVDVPGRRGVVLVHGFVCNRGLWNPWLSRLRARGVPFVAVNLEPVFGSIDGYAPVIDDAVRRLTRGTGKAPVVVAHSMGGVAVRAWLDRCADDSRVLRVITVGSPHAGTALGAFAYSSNARQMRDGSPWLRQLGEREPASRAARFTCFYGHCDNIVFPASNATLSGADNRHVAGCAHLQMSRSEQVFDELASWLECEVATPEG